MSLSTDLTTFAENLTTETGHEWAINEGFDALVSGVRQGRIYVNWHTIPEGMEQWLYEVSVQFDTRLQSQNSADRLSNIDYSLALNAHIQKAALDLLDVTPTNGDRHAAVLDDARQNVDVRPGNIDVVTTTHLYTVQHTEPEVRLLS